MQTMQTMETIPLMLGSARSRKSYNQLLRLVLIGAVRGEQREGRWVVSVEDVERLRRDSDDARTAARA